MIPSKIREFDPDFCYILKLSFYLICVFKTESSVGGGQSDYGKDKAIYSVNET